MILFRSYDGNPTDRPGFFPVVSPSRQERLAILEKIGLKVRHNGPQPSIFIRSNMTLPSEIRMKME